MKLKTLEIQLKKSARQTAEWREHRMSNFKKITPYRFESVCKACAMKMYVELKPAPNSINIYGEAVALNCKYCK